MFDNLTCQSLPEEHYLCLVGAAICAFSSNNAFIIENILHTNDEDYSWYALTDLESGYLHNAIAKTISPNDGGDIQTLFDEIVKRRNRIVHSFRITDTHGKQRLATKTRVKEGNKQLVIDESYLEEFIVLNSKLSVKLNAYRDSLKSQQSK